MTLEQLSGPHASELRNPLIAEAFHRTGAVEVWGRGTNRVIAECKAHGILPPSFEERQRWMVVTFRAPIAPVEAAGGPEGGTEKSREKMAERMAERMAEKTPGRILSVLTDHPEATIADLAAVIGVSDRTIERNLKTLQGQNRIRRIGPDKGGRWEVIP